MVLWERNKMKQKFIHFNLDFNEDFDFDLNEMVIGTIDDKFGIETHSSSKFLLYCFNNLRRDFGEEAYKIRHIIISEDLHELEKLQSRDWSYFIDRLLEISDGGISSLNLFNFDQNRNTTEKIEIINDTIENLKICKNYYSDIYANVSSVFQIYVQNASEILIQKIRDDIRLNLF